MSFASTRRLVPGLVVLLAACGSNSAGAAFGGEVSVDGGAGAQVQGVSFDDAGTLQALPSQAVDIGLTVTGGSDASVTVWLEGDYADASLGADEVTSRGGHATVTLRTPSSTTTFTMGARIAGGSDARIAVSVSSTGFTTVHVFPAYQGRRAHATYRASAFVHSTCSDLAGSAIHDGSLTADGVDGAAIALGGVPSGGHVAVTARAGHYGFGCVDIDGLVPAGDTALTVKVYDVPMALDRTDLQASFAFEPDPGSDDAKAWQTMLVAAGTRVAAAFFTGAEEGTALLDAMRGTVVTASDKALFDAARAKSAWDAKAAAWLSARAPTIRARAQVWLDAAAAPPFGSMVAQLGPGPSAVTARVTLLSFDGVAASGFADPAPFDWTADAQDEVHLAGRVTFWSTALVALLADARARTAIPAATDVASAIARDVDCAGLGDALAGPTYAYSTCDGACMAAACQSALAARWASASAVGTTALGDRTALALTAGAAAEVGDYAEPLRFRGTWLAQVSAPTGASSMKGHTTAEQSPPH